MEVLTVWKRGAGRTIQRGDVPGYQPEDPLKISRSPHSMPRGIGWALLRAAAVALAVAAVAPAGTSRAAEPAGSPLPPAAGTAPAGGKELIAVLDLDIVGSSREQSAVLTNQLRTELLKTGRFTMVDRARLDQILNEQALQQTICTEPQCAVRAGRILGVRKVVTGSVTKVTDTLWQVAVSITDVETAEVTRQEVLNHVGDFSTLFLSGMAALAKKLSATSEELAAGLQRLTPQSINPSQFDVIRAGNVRAIALSTDNALLYYAVGAKVTGRNILNHAPAGAPVEVPRGDITALAVNIAGDRLAIGTTKGRVYLADPASGKILSDSDAGGEVTTVAFSPAGNYFATGSDDETASVYYARNGERAYRLDNFKQKVESVRFSQDGKLLLAAEFKGNVRVFDVNLQKQVRGFLVESDRLHAAEMSRDGAYVGISARKIQIDLARSRRTDVRFISIRDFNTGEELSNIQAHEKDIAGLAFFPDSRFIATAALDGTVKIWDLQAKSSLANLGVDGRVTGLGLSPNGHWLVAADDSGRITIWEVVK
jgi:hypothetical protein